MFDFDKISASKFYVAPSVERVVEFSPPDIDMSNVSRVLSLAVDAKCVGAEAFDGYAQASGRTNFRLAYLDGDGVPKGVDYNADFTVRVDGEFVEGDSVSCDVVVTEADVNAGDTLTLTAVLEIKVSAIKRDEIDVLVGAENCYTTTKEVFIPSFIATKTTIVPFDDEINVGTDVQTVLGLNTVCVVKETVAREGGANAKLRVFARVTYVENGDVKQQDYDIPLEEEMNLDGVVGDDAIMLCATVKSSKVVLQGVTDDNVIRVEGELQLKVSAFRCAKTSIISDVFMLSNDIEIERDTARYQCFDGCGYFVQSVSGTAVLGDNRPRALSVNALPYARCYTSRAYLDDDNRLVVEGVADTDIIYTDENGYNSVRAEIPFALGITSEIPFSKQVSARCEIQRINAVVRMDREFEVSMDVAVSACGYSPLETEYISAVTVGEERAQNKSALSIYVTGEGEDMLDVCKALSAMPDDVLSQNPDLQPPFKEGEKIIYFRRI